MSQAVRVFLLEDDEDLREALVSVLELEGYEVLSAADGVEAVGKASERTFDIIVFDVKLPGPDGLEVFSQLKNENPDLLSIVMTGYATEQDTLRALRLGVGDYLKKPFRSSVLIEAVKRLETELLRRRKMEERERAAQSLLLWSLEFLVGGLEIGSNGQGMSLVESATTAKKIALASGFSQEAALELQCAVLYSHLLSKSEGGPRLETLKELLPSSVTSLAQEMGEPDQTSLESLAGLGVCCLELPSQPDGLSRLEKATGLSLGGATPQRLDRERRQLLSLGRTLVASGQAQAARDAFQRLADGSRSYEAGQGLLELAQLAWSRGDGTEVKSSLRKLVALLPQLGPQAAAKLELEAGFAALGMGLADGCQLLERGRLSLQRMGHQNLTQQAAIGLLAGRPERPLSKEDHEGLRILAETGPGELLLSNSWWLLPPLLERLAADPVPSLRRIAARLVAEATRSVSKVLAGPLSPAQLELLLDLIGEVGPSALTSALQRLFAQTDSRAVRTRVEALLAAVEQNDVPTLRLHLLGPFEVWIGEERLPDKVWRTYRSRFLLACLASRGGKPILADTVIEQFWPDVRPDAGKKNLSQTASDLRKTLTEHGFDPSEDLVIRKHDVIALNFELPLWNDLDAFRSEFSKGKQCLQLDRHRQAHQHLRQAFSLIRGEYLEDCPMEWATGLRREMERQATECCELLASVCKELGHFPELIEVASRILDRDPCHQPLQVLVMEAQTSLGRPELALRQFESAKASLLSELGVEPSTELLRAEQFAKMAL